MKVCRICLSKDGRLYPIISNGLHALYNQLIGILKLEADADKGLPQWLCAECGLRLMSYNKLRQKSLRSHQILSKLLDKKTCITDEDINTIDREKYNLQSNLSYSVLDQGIIIEFEIDSPKSDETDRKPDLKIKEFLITLEGGETSSMFKTENDSDEYHSETAVSTTDNISERDCESCVLSENGSLSSDSSCTTNRLLKTLASTSLKTKDKKVRLHFMKRVDQYINSLNKSPTKKVKNEVKQKVPSLSSLKREIKKEKLDLKKDVEQFNKTNKRVKKDVEVKSVKKRVRKNTKHVNKEVAKKASTAYPIEDIFTIQTLSMEEQLAEFNSRQYDKTYMDAPFKCGDCFNGFYTDVAFSKHMLKHSDEGGKIECKICKTRMRTRKRYYTHMIAHKTIFRCKECSFITRMRAMARTHRLKHKGKVYSCPHCDLKFVNNNTYMLHLRVKHVTNSACELCGYSFVNARGVLMHKNLKHAQEKGKEIVATAETTCPTCNIGFASDKALETHLKVSHLQQQPNFIRDDWPYALVERADIICEICGEKTSGCIAYRNHFRAHHPNTRPTRMPIGSRQAGQPRQQYVCEQCGQAFQQKAYLNTHALSHTEERPFKCHDCNKTFISTAAVQKHIQNVHQHEGRTTAEPWYSCHVCGKAFNKQHNMKRHLVVHTGLRQYVCEVCGSSFKTKGEVQSHNTHVHLKKPWPKKKEPRSGARGHSY